MITPKEYKLFSTSIYTEHFEEASFLYEHRLSLWHDPELSWLDLDDYDNRFEAHVYGLVLGGELALSVCQTQLEQGYAADLHVAMRVFCRQNRFDLFYEAITEIDPEDQEFTAAVYHALCRELPTQWLERITDFSNYENLYRFRTEIVRAIGSGKRVQKKHFIMSLFEQEKDVTVLETVIWAIGQLKIEPLSERLDYIYFSHDNDAIRKAAFLALLKMRVNERTLLMLSSNNPINFPYLGHAGNNEATQKLRHFLKTTEVKLLDFLKASGVNNELVLAAGISGCAEFPNILLDFLKGDYVENASVALYLITGAPLIERVFVPDEIDEDELFEEDKEKLARGEPLYKKGEGPGTTVERISQDRDTWESWLRKEKETYENETRTFLRLGRSLTKETAIDSLLDPHIPNRVRQLLYEALSVRYTVSEPFSYEMTAQEQISQIDKMKATPA